MGNYYVRQGHSYMGGASKPFFMTYGMLVQGAQDQGFEDARAMSRKDFPVANLPPLPAGTSDDWDTIGMGRRASGDGAVDLPGAVRWVVDVTPQAAPQPLPEQVNPQTGEPTAPLPGGSLEPTWEPAVYPNVIVPDNLPWTTIPTSLATEIIVAAAVGTAGAVALYYLFGR